MRLSLARDRDRERGLATASLSGARMMSLFAAFAGGKRGVTGVSVRGVRGNWGGKPWLGWIRVLSLCSYT